MARTRTLLQLRDEVRQRADMVNSDFVTNDEINRYLNESISELYDMLISCKGQEWYMERHTFVTVANQHDYLISTNIPFYILLGVDADLGGSSPIPLRPYMLDERHDRWLGSGLQRARYRLSGSVDPASGVYQHRITLKPAPTAAGTNITLLYIPHAPILDNDADVWDGFNGWEEYAIVDAAIKCLEKEESSTIALERRKERLMERIEGLAASHDNGFPERVVDITGRVIDPYIL